MEFNCRAFHGYKYSNTLFHWRLMSQSVQQVGSFALQFYHDKLNALLIYFITISHQHYFLHIFFPSHFAFSLPAVLISLSFSFSLGCSLFCLNFICPFCCLCEHFISIHPTRKIRRMENFVSHQFITTTIYSEAKLKNYVEQNGEKSTVKWGQMTKSKNMCCKLW